MDRSPVAMILAAGYGTRLGALSQLRPKPMLPLCGAPLVRWAALWLRHHGVREVVVNLHHLGHQIAEELGDGSGLGMKVSYTHEEGLILGTGGGLRNARHLLDDGSGRPIVVVNGKIMIDFDLSELLAVHGERGAEATMLLREDAEGVWGSGLALDGEGRLARLLGEDREGVVERPMMFTGVHVFEPTFLDRVPPEGEQCIVRTAYRGAFREGKVFGHVTDRYWWEHSTPERYRAGVRNVLDGKVDLPFAERPIRGVLEGAEVHPEATVVDPVWIGPGAVVEAGASVGPHAMVEGGARIASGATVRDAVVWSGVTIEGQLEGDVRVPDPEA